MSATLSVAGMLVAIPLGAVAGAPSAGGSPAGAPATEAVVACRALTDDSQRLACYDKAVAAMADAEKTGDLLTMDRAQRRAVRRQAFGLSLPSLAIFDKGEKPEEAGRITAKVAAARQDPYKKWIVRLDDGAVWRQTDDNELFNDPHAGSTVEIRNGALGSFFMKVDGQPAIRVHRDS
jgi:hypothetical protein